jgi:LemA protein
MGIVITIVVIVIVLALVAWVIGKYNGLIRARNAFKNAFAQIDVQLQRRFDLIPNLVETAKAYMAHERDTLEAVVQARGAAMAGLSAAQQNPGDPQAMAQLAQSQGMLNGALGRLIAVAEAYPDLKANQNMMQLSEELTTTENKVAFSRQAYNDSVMSYNNRRESFPTSVLAGMFNFQPAALLEIPQDRTDIREAPRVSFGTDAAPPAASTPLSPAGSPPAVPPSATPAPVPSAAPVTPPTAPPAVPPTPPTGPVMPPVPPTPPTGGGQEPPAPGSGTPA